LAAGNFTFRLTPALRVELVERARVHGWSVSDEVRYVLERSLAERDGVDQLVARWQRWAALKARLYE
jgi:plasmid stability protein